MTRVVLWVGFGICMMFGVLVTTLGAFQLTVLSVVVGFGFYLALKQQYGE